MAKSPHISRAKMESIVAGGGSVTHRGRIIKDVNLLPSAAELAEGDDEARAQVLLNLDKQQQEIDRQRRMLQFDELRNEQKPGPLDAQLAGDPVEARRHPPRQTPADPDAELRTAHKVMVEMYGHAGTFEEFKAEHAKRTARMKAEAAEKAKESEAVPTKEGEPQDAEHPHVEGKTAHEVVEESRGPDAEEKKDEPAPDQHKKHGRR